jgi:hypothetical protein
LSGDDGDDDELVKHRVAAASLAGKQDREAAGRGGGKTREAERKQWKRVDSVVKVLLLL